MGTSAFSVGTTAASTSTVIIESLAGGVRVSLSSLDQLIVVCSSHKVLIKPSSRSSPGCPQTSQVRMDSSSAASLANGVIRMIHIEAQPAKFLFNLQDFKLASGCPLEFGDQRF
jgi:hypothetical protein